MSTSVASKQSPDGPGHEERGPSILLVGSYNGQDSLGDRCLLRVVADRFDRLARGALRIHLHAHDPTGDWLKELPVETGQGLQSRYWSWHNKLRHARLPGPVHRRFSELTFPFIWRHLRADGVAPEEVLDQLRGARFMYVFGGTNFAQQWWWMNAVPYMLTAAIGQLPVYLGPQQYGPMTSRQQRRTKSFIRRHVKGIRSRNPACLEELGLPSREPYLVRDEVFSNVNVYPVTHRRSGAAGRRRILVNLRGGRDFLVEQADGLIRGVATYLERLGDALDCEFAFFDMSGASFCDDGEAFEALHTALPPRFRFQRLPYKDDRAVLEAARNAYACVSMSFHGCILAMIAGCPAVPVTSGRYYDRKYVGFEAYNPAHLIPIFRPPESSCDSFVARSLRYFEEYNPVEVGAARRRSHERIESYYRQILRERACLTDPARPAP